MVVIYFSTWSFYLFIFFAQCAFMQQVERPVIHEQGHGKVNFIVSFCTFPLHICIVWWKLYLLSLLPIHTYISVSLSLKALSDLFLFISDVFVPVFLCDICHCLRAP